MIEKYLALPSEAFFRGIEPNPLIGIREYAEKNIRLTSDTPFPGLIKFSKNPFLIQILDDLEEDNGIEEVVFVKGWQVGGTLSLLCWMLHSAACSPCPTMVVQPKDWLADNFSKKRLDPILKNSKDLQGKIKDAEQKGQDTLNMKTFPGGFILVANAGSATNLRSFSIKKVAFDEVSDYPEDCQGQGDPCRLALGRTSAFEGRKKLFYLSTPTIKGSCRIERAYKSTQKFRYFVKCPHCGTYQTIEWENLRWKVTTESVRLHCIGCSETFVEHDKPMLLDSKTAYWKATAEDSSGGKRRGYHLSALYSPLGMYSWASAVSQFLLGKKEPSEMKVFVNNVKAETWEQVKIESIDQLAIKKTAHEYSLDKLPEGVGLITAGIDTHPNLIDILVRGWGRGQESWVLDWVSIDGDANMESTWDRVYQNLCKEYEHHTGIMLPISAVAIDSGGHNTQAVYDFVRPLFSENIIAIKGIGTVGYPTIGKPSRPDETDVLVYPVGSHTTKSRLFRSIAESIKFYQKIEKAKKEGEKDIPEFEGPGICHFHKDLPAGFFKEMSSPRAIRRKFNGQMRTIIEAPDGAADHAFDCARYAAAALYWLKIDLDRHCDDLDGGDIFTKTEERSVREIIR